MTTQNHTRAAIVSNSTLGAPTMYAESADAFLAAARAQGDFPVAMRQSSAVHVTDHDGRRIKSPKHTSILCDYRNSAGETTTIVAGINGGRYKGTTIEAWEATVRAAVAAGGIPAYSLNAGGKIVAQFEIAEAGGIKSYLTLADSFDGSCGFIAGRVDMRWGCMNMLSGLRASTSRAAWANIRHTASLEERIGRLRVGIEEIAKGGEELVDLFNRASAVHLPAAAAREAFDALFPKANEGAKRAAVTRAENMRAAARIAAAMPINRVGGKGNLATLWNAATYLVDRDETGAARKARGESTRAAAMLFGRRGRRVEQIRHLVDVVLADGTIEAMTVDKATEAGVDAGQLGAGVLAAMLADLD